MSVDTSRPPTGRLGAFGMKIPAEYGGLGFSNVEYNRGMTLLGTHCGDLAALLSAHQSIGVPQPLLVFGTEEQKKRLAELREEVQKEMEEKMRKVYDEIFNGNRTHLACATQHNDVHQRLLALRC